MAFLLPVKKREVNWIHVWFHPLLRATTEVILHSDYHLVFSTVITAVSHNQTSDVGHACSFSNSCQEKSMRHMDGSWPWPMCGGWMGWRWHIGAENDLVNWNGLRALQIHQHPWSPSGMDAILKLIPCINLGNAVQVKVHVETSGSKGTKRNRKQRQANRYTLTDRGVVGSHF